MILSFVLHRLKLLHTSCYTLPSLNLAQPPIQFLKIAGVALCSSQQAQTLLNRNPFVLILIPRVGTNQHLHRSHSGLHSLRQSRAVQELSGEYGGEDIAGAGKADGFLLIRNRKSLLAHPPIDPVPACPGLAQAGDDRGSGGHGAESIK